MSDAREIVQPRWKRRATEIAEAIGGTSTGTSSVSLDSNTITQLSQAIADAIDLKVLDINIKQYDDGLVSSSGLPIRTGTGPVSGGFLPLRVVTDIGDKVDINVKQYNDVDVDTRGLPVQAGRTVTNNTLVPLVVNCPTVNNFPTGGSGGTTTFPSTMDVNIVKFGGGPNISASAHLPITGFVDCRQDTGSLRPWIISTGVQGSNTLGQWGNTSVSTDALKASQLNLDSTSKLRVVAEGHIGVDITHVDGITIASGATLPTTGGGGGGTTLTQQQVETAMDNALSNATGISVTEIAPVTTVAVSNHPTSTTITGTVAVTETAPVTTVAVNNHPTTTEVTLPLDANGVPIPMKVTETHPVYGTNVQEVKIVGDETYGIIMSTTFYGTSTPYNIGDYTTIGFGKGASLWQTNVQGVQAPGGPASGPQHTDGWTIRVNGVDIPNQDISFHLRGSNHVPPQTLSNPNYNNATLASLYPRLIQADSQATIDKYRGRKVTLSSVANVWIVHPLDDVSDILVSAQSLKGTVHWTSSNNDYTIIDDNGVQHNAVVYKNKALQNHSQMSSIVGLRVVRTATSSTFWQTIDAISH